MAGEQTRYRIAVKDPEWRWAFPTTPMYEYLTREAARLEITARPAINCVRNCIAPSNPDGTFTLPAEPQGEKRCPTCDSRDPKLHPAMQFEGEVQECRDPFHVQPQQSPPPVDVDALSRMCRRVEENDPSAKWVEMPVEELQAVIADLRRSRQRIAELEHRIGDRDKEHPFNVFKERDELQQSLTNSIAEERRLRALHQQEFSRAEIAESRVAELEGKLRRAVCWDTLENMAEQCIADRAALLERVAELEAEAGRLRSAIGMDTPWPVNDVLRELMNGVTILMDRHSYDGHGYEVMAHAYDAARIIRDQVDRLKRGGGGGT